MVLRFVFEGGIRKVDPSKRINNKTEYHQPGDVEVRYEKGQNEDVKRRKRFVREKSQENNSKLQETEVE
jgi:hypothetical protein